MDDLSPQPAVDEAHRPKVLVASVAIVVLLVATIGIAAAQPDRTPLDTPTSAPDADADDADPDDDDGDQAADDDEAAPDPDACFGFFGPSPEELGDLADEIAAQMEALKEAFDEAGIAYTELPDHGLGIGIIEWDFDDDAANEVAENVFEGLFGGVIAGFGDHLDELPEDLADEIRAEMEALRDAFTEMLDGELGVPFDEWDLGDDAANEVADSVFESLFGEGGVFEVPFGHPDDSPEGCGDIVFEGCGDIGFGPDGFDGFGFHHDGDGFGFGFGFGHDRADEPSDEPAAA